MTVHIWGDEWFEEYGDDLSAAMNYIQKMNKRLTGQHIMMKEKYGTIRYESCFNWESTNEHVIILVKILYKTVKKWPHIALEILEDMDFVGDDWSYFASTYQGGYLAGVKATLERLEYHNDQTYC